MTIDRSVEWCRRDGDVVKQWLCLRSFPILELLDVYHTLKIAYSDGCRATVHMLTFFITAQKDLPCPMFKTFLPSSFT
jgi:hypothetical protein